MILDPNENIDSQKSSGCHIYPLILKSLHRKEAVSLSQMINQLKMDGRILKRALHILEKNGFISWERKPGISIQDNRMFLKTDTIYFAGFDLGGSKLYGAVTNLAGEILFDSEIRNHGKSGEACYELLVGSCTALLKKAAQKGYGIRGIGVQVPGCVQLETGLVLRAPAVKWEGFPLKKRLVAKFGLPVFIDNDLKQSALGEVWFGAGRKGSNVALVAIGTGIAAGIVVNDVLQRGAHLRHGEIGWMVPGREFLNRQYTGYGACEMEAGGAGIARRARLILGGKRSEEELASLTGEDVFASARAGEEWAKQVVKETVEFLAVLIANVMAFYDPDIIILSGGVSRASDLLIEPILQLVEGCVRVQPNIVLSTLGYQAGVLGAVVNLLMNCPEIYQGVS